MRDDFAVFILSHGRPDRIKTIQALQNGNYGGKWYVVIDNEDDTESEYRRLFGERVIQFDKLEQSLKFDTADTNKDRRTIVYARNACFDIAEQLGIRYFLELDDDYTAFMFRRIEGQKMTHTPCKNLGRLFEKMVDFLDDSGALTVALAQGGDFIGGANSGTFKKKVLRKAMNTFFCDTHKRFDFLGRINEDVNTYTCLGNRGHLFFTVTDAMICQLTTQANAGGMTDVYLDSGTYLKSFYSVIFSPQAVRIKKMGAHHRRLHHNIAWNFCAPKILNQKWKK